MIPIFRGRTRGRSKVKAEEITNRVNLDWTKSLNISKSEWNNPSLIREISEGIPSQKRTFSCSSPWTHFRAWCCTFSCIRIRSRKFVLSRRIFKYRSEHWLFKFFKYNSKPYIFFSLPNFISIWIHPEFLKTFFFWRQNLKNYFWL